MLNWLQKMKNMFNKKNKTYTMEDLDLSEIKAYVKDLKVEQKLHKNITVINELLGESYDLSIREFKLAGGDIRGIIVFLSGMIESRALERLFHSLEIEIREVKKSTNKIKAAYKKGDLLEYLSQNILNNESLVKTNDFKEVFTDLTSGGSAVFLDGINEVLLCETRGYAVRSLEEPNNEIVIRGPREGFVENLYTNTSLIRKRLKIPNLWLEEMEIGDLSQSKVVIAYIKGLASEELLNEVKDRLKKIDIDTVLESNIVQEYLTDSWLSPFPQIIQSERPDRAVSCLVEGKVVILVENTPFVLMLPATLNMFLQAPDDYNDTFIVSSLIRLLRYFTFLVSIFLPGLYIAIANYNPELLPVSFLLRIASTREGVPFPLIVESLLMEGVFEILREAGLRLPMAIGSALSIVGALVLGEAAINAGLVSPPMVIVVAITAIASFTVPNYSMGLAARILRFGFLFLGGLLGMFGIQFGILLVLIHLCSLRSFGQPYFQPFAPLIWQDLKDTLIRAPWWSLGKRPVLMGGREPERQPPGQKPEKPSRIINSEEKNDG
ncbi:MAG: spore germination protein [Halanaerobiales bacterium]